MHKHKRRNEGILYEAPNTRSKIHNEVKDELAGTETFLTDSQGLRLAYESPDGLYQNGSILYIAGTKSMQDAWDDLKLPFHKTRLTQRYKDANKHIQENEGITDIISHSLGSSVSAQLNQDYDNQLEQEVTVLHIGVVRQRKISEQTLEYAVKTMLLALLTTHLSQWIKAVDWIFSLITALKEWQM